METKFKAGDLVRHRAGSGPIMVVVYQGGKDTEIPEEQREYYCTWFTLSDRKSGMFFPIELIPYNIEEK